MNLQVSIKVLAIVTFLLIQLMCRKKPYCNI